MNRYGMQMMKHCQTYLPNRYAALGDPNSFFSTLGEQAAQQIADLTMQLAGPDQPDERYLDKVGRLNNARQRAEEIVLSELILIDPESNETEAGGAQIQTTPAEEWIPLVEDPSNPHWRQIAEEEAAMADEDSPTGPRG